MEGGKMRGVQNGVVRGGEGVRGEECVEGGRIKGLDKDVGGKIYEREHLIFPSEEMKPFFF